MTAVAGMVQQKLYSTFHGNAATRSGLENEDSAKQYLTHLRMSSPDAKVATTCRLVVSVVHPWLAATPDGWVYDSTLSEGLVAFKKPSSCKEMKINEATKAKKCNHLTVSNGTMQLKWTHNYHYQIQTTMEEDSAIL